MIGATRPVERRRGSGLDGPTRRRDWIVGSVDQVKARLAELEAAGVSGVYLQHCRTTATSTMVELIGTELT